MPSNKTFEIICPKCSEERTVPYGQYWAIKKGITSTICFSCSRMKKGITNNGSFKLGQVSPNKGNIGEKNPKWIKDRSKVKGQCKRSKDPYFNKWSREVKKRDKNICRIADVNCDGGLEAHHILPWSEFPELRYQINNGITLCHAHHPRKKDEVVKLSPYFQKLVAIKE